MVTGMVVPEYEVIVCYDVSDNKRRRILANALLDLGLIPVQKSVFWGVIRRAEEKSVLREFRRLLDPASDKAFLCHVNLSKVADAAGFGYIPGELNRPEPYNVVV